MRILWRCGLVLALGACGGERYRGYLPPPMQVDGESSLGRLDAAIAAALRASYVRSGGSERPGDLRTDAARRGPGDPSEPDPLEHVLLLVDTSASRAPFMGRQAALVRALVARMSPSTELAVAAFDQDVTDLYRGPARAGAAAADAMLERGALGASNLGGALARAAARGAGRVIVIGDGAPTLGETAPARLASFVHATTIERVDAIQIGPALDRESMRAIVRAARHPGAILDDRDPDRLFARLTTAADQDSHDDEPDEGAPRGDAVREQGPDPVSTPDTADPYVHFEVERMKIFREAPSLIVGDGEVVDGPCFGMPDGPWFGLNGWDSPIAPTFTGYWIPPAPKYAAPYAGEFFEVMSAIAHGDRRHALAIASAWQLRSPRDVAAIIALGEALEARGASALAARAYGSLVDLYPERPDVLGAAGERLDRIVGARELAIAAYRRALRERPDRISIYRLLAYDLMLEGRAEALDVLFEGIKRAQRPSVQQILREDHAMIASYLLAHAPSQRGDVTARLRARPPDRPSIRFVLSWDTDAADVDLHVRDRHGDLAWFANRELRSGGHLLDDITAGFGPEMFEVDAPDAYPYRLRVHSSASGPDGITLGAVQIIRYEGPGRLTVETRPFAVQNDDAVLDLGGVEAM